MILLKIIFVEPKIFFLSMILPLDGDGNMNTYHFGK